MFTSSCSAVKSVEVSKLTGCFVVHYADGSYIIMDPREALMIAQAVAKEVLDREASERDYFGLGHYDERPAAVS